MSFLRTRAVFQPCFIVLSLPSNCWKKKGHDRAVIQLWRSRGIPNVYAPYQVHACREAGIDDIQFYMFPDAKMDVEEQVLDMLAFMKDNGIDGGRMMWIDIEAPSLFKPTCAENVKFLKDIIASLEKHYDGPIGIYASHYQWKPIMCGNTEFTKYPLWWPHYDSNPDMMHNWSSFGGWAKPVMKQYNGDKVVCGQDVDLDSYE